MGHVAVSSQDGVIRSSFFRFRIMLLCSEASNSTISQTEEEGRERDNDTLPIGRVRFGN